MSTKGRRQRILELVRRRGFVEVDALARHFAVTPQTIRRDFNVLSAADLLSRYRGGAGLPSSVVNTDYALRKIIHLAEKEVIAEAIADYLPDRASLYITNGTTMETVARALVKRSHMTVITSNIHVAATLLKKADFEVIMPGGIALNRNGGLVGASVIDFIDRFRVDYAIFGIGAIEMDGAMLEYDFAEICVAQAMMRNARQILIAADHTKFHRKSSALLCRVEDISALFTDRRPPEPLVERMALSDVELHIAAAAPLDAAIAE